MRGAVALACAVLAMPVLAQDGPPDGAGPRGTSGEAREDVVGRTSLLTVSAGATPTVRIAAMHPTLPSGSFVEITALDTGKTIVAMVVGAYRGRGVVGLSPDAAQALGIASGAAVRVRAVTPNPQDQAALRRGEAAGTRLDAPPALLTALRKKLAGGMTLSSGAVPERSARPTTIAAAAAAPKPARMPVRGGYAVQVAAVSSPERAAALARALGGQVVPNGRLYRVQLGPFADANAANRARDTAARRGYADARVFHSE